MENVATMPDDPMLYAEPLDVIPLPVRTTTVVDVTVLTVNS